MQIDRLPGVYYEEDMTYELAGQGSKIPVFIGVTGNKNSYKFISYSDANKQTVYGNGKVIETGVVDGDYTQVQVLTNSTDVEFIGKKFFIKSDAITDGETPYQLQDENKQAIDIYVTITDDYKVDGTVPLKYSKWIEVNTTISNGGILKGSETDWNEIDTTVKESNRLYNTLKDFFEESRVKNSGDIGVPYIYIIDVGDGENYNSWTTAIKTAKKLLDVEIEIYDGAVFLEDNTGENPPVAYISKTTTINDNGTTDIVGGVELKDFLNPLYSDLDYGLSACERNLDLRCAFTTIYDKEFGHEKVTDEQLLKYVKSLTTDDLHSRIGLVEPFLFGKTIARICCTPYNTEPGYYRYRSVNEGVFKERTKAKMLELQDNGIIFNSDEHINSQVYPKINLCVSMSFTNSGNRPADSLFHARFNADSLLREVFEACYHQVKANESATNIAYLQTRINKIVNDRVTAEEMVKWNDKEETGTKLTVQSADIDPYSLVVKGYIQPVKCTIAIKVKATIRL